MNSMEQLFVDPHAECGEDRKTFDALAGEDRKTFDALAIAARELEGGEFSQFEIAFTEQRIFDQLDALQEPEDLHDPSDEPEDVTKIGAARRRGILALVAAAALVGYITLPTQGSGPTDRYQARSASTPDHTAKPKVHVYCVRTESDGVQFVGASDSPFGVVRCGQQDDLKIAYENPDAGLQYAYFAGLGPDGSVRWYGPTPAEPGELTINVTSKPTPIGQTRRLSINHIAGTYDVFGLFSSRPVSLDEFEATMKRANREDTIDGHVIVRTTFEVRP